MLKSILRVFYGIKHKGSLNELHKLIEVVMSCSRPEHCETASRYLALWKARYVDGISEDGYTRTATAVIDQISYYLTDTKEHCEFGTHCPKHNGGVPLATFPNMNNYVGRVLSVKFNGFWEEGANSVAGPK